MIRRAQLFGFATIFLVGCSGVSTPPQSSTSTDSAEPASTAAVPAIPASPVSPRQPLGTVTVPGVPGLVAQTNAKNRANGVAGGRVDPFAIVPSGPSVIPVKVITSAKPRLQPQTTTNPVTVLPAQPSPIAVNPLPLPNLSPGTTNFPPANTPRLPPPSPTAIADRVNITGVIQLQNKWHVIIQESPASSSRYVKAGDTLAGGQVLVKRVIAGADPLVVLQQNGKEVTRRIGDGLTPNV